MHALPICLLEGSLSGCYMLRRSPVEHAQCTATPPVKSEKSKQRATRKAPLRIY
ncbi:Rcs stress response system protein RcsF, partial [Klebsiella pneumoniae]